MHDNYRKLVRNLRKRKDQGVSPNQTKFDKWFKKYISHGKKSKNTGVVKGVDVG